MALNVKEFATVEMLGAVSSRTVAAIAPAFKSLSVSGNTVSFFTSTDGTGTAAASFDFPEEIFLDQAGTALAENFSWSAAAYPNSTNPNLEGKTVLVLAVKGDKQTNPSVKYSFVNLEKLIDTYTAADNSVVISGYTVAVKISAVAGNVLELKSDGLYVASPKTPNATSGNVPLFDSDGGLVNSTIVGGDIITKVAGATTDNIATFSSDGKIADSTIAIDDVVTKVTGGTAGHVVILDSDGKIADSTLGIASLAEVNAYLDSIFG